MPEPKVELIICLSILSLMYFTIVQGDCIIEYPNNAETSPIYKKHIGKYTVQLPYNQNGVHLKNGEIISGLCRTNFSSISLNYQQRDRWNNQRNFLLNYKNISSITLHCQNHELLFNNSVLVEKVLECASLNWSIYDANESYDWCEKNENFKNFLLAAKSRNDHHILAGICYDLDKWSLQTVTYNVTYLQISQNMEMLRDVTKTGLESLQSLGDDLWNLKSIKGLELADDELQKQIMELSKTNSWLHLANYEMSSIVQGDSYKNYFSEYINILNIMWWHNLRLGNWKLFMNTLENYAYNNSFQLYTGSSGEVKVPVKDSSVHNNILQVKNGYKNETVPAYIWTYLKSTDNLNKDFIIVGYNSPYAEFFSLKNVIFCPDICSEIVWLNEIYKSFRFTTAGVMFCCSSEFIRETSFLPGFPVDVLVSRIGTTRQNETEIEAQTLASSTKTDQIEDIKVEVKTENLLHIRDNDKENEELLY